MESILHITSGDCAGRDLSQLSELSLNTAVALPWIPAAATRWLAEQPDLLTGFGRLEQLVLDAITNLPLPIA